MRGVPPWTRGPRPRRVLHVSPASFGKDGLFGGGERYPYELAKAMSLLCPVTFLTFGTQNGRFRDGALEVRVLRTRGRWKSSEVNPLAEGLLAEVSRADVVHVHQWESVVANACVTIGHALRKRIYATDHGGSGPNYWRSLRLHRFLTGFIPVSSFGAAFYPEMVDRTHIMIGGVDTVHFSPDPSVARRPRAVFVGRLLPHKGIDRVIDAIPPTLELLVVGRPYDAAYREYLGRRAEGKRVEFREQLGDDELVDAYRSSRVAVLPSVYQPSYGPPSKNPELLGLTLLEAMACGTPAVCTAVGGMPEVVLDGRTGFVVDPNDLDRLAGSLGRLIHDDALWAPMSESALARARALSWATVATRCLALYDRGEVTDGRSPLASA